MGRFLSCRAPALTRLALAVSLSLGSAALWAQAPADGAPRQIRIAAQPLGDALNAWARQTGTQLAVPQALVAGKAAPAVSGLLTPRQALDRLPAGSGLAASLEGGAAVIKAAPAAPEAGGPALSTVTVSAERDPSTEGLDSYAAPAATIGLGQHTLRETPNSVSVITRQRIEDQNMVTLADAMQYTTAVKVTSYGTSTAGIESRGYTIDHYQIDGLSSSARVYENNFSLAMFDRLEVLRGPAGLLQGAGDPGGTINFVRKRALDTFGLSARTSAGSWNNYYADIDVTGPLNEDRSLRGRVVAAYQDRHYFTDYAWTRQPMLYGTLEYDFTPGTTLSVGASWQRSHGRPFFGLASYEAGGFPDVPRSTYIGTSWGRQTQEVARGFAELEHKLDGGGTARVLAAYQRRNNPSAFSWGNSYADPATGNVNVIPYYSTGQEHEFSIDGRVTLPMQWRGLKQEFVLGANYQRLRSDSSYNGLTWGENGFDQDIFHPNIDVPKPVIALDWPSSARQTQSGLYGAARIKPWQPLTLIAGARLAWFRNEDLLAPGNALGANGQVVPYAGAIYDLSREFSAYASYSDIFSPQADTDYLGRYLSPRKGRQYEVGIKGAHLGGQLLSSVALYRIEDVNRAMADPSHPNASIAAGEVQSEGMEAELSGRIAPNWKFTAGYGYNTTRQVRASADQQGLNFSTQFPRHTVSLWTDYRFSDDTLRGLSLALGMKMRSSIYDTSNLWRQGAVTVFALQAGYQFTPSLRGTLTVNNLLDKHYRDRVDGWSRQSYFGEPRSIMFTLAYKI